MSSPPSESTQRPLLSRLVQAIFSSADDNNVMMAAIVSLVVVVLFVLILHLYARSSFHSRSLRRHSRRRRRSPNSESQIPPIPISSFVLDLAARSAKGLEASAIAAIPLFVSGGEESECVVCLSVFDGGEIGRRLPKCGHEFHVECIDMWLQSHSNCPICRAPVMAIQENNTSASSDLSEIVEIADRGDSRVGEEGGDGFLVIEIDGNNNESSAEIHGSSEIGCSSSSSFGSSLKRMLSRNRSERKVSPVNIAESTG